MSNMQTDNSFIAKYLGFDVVQRAQVRVCLSDFDRNDAVQAHHVMRSYPFASHIFTFLFIGVLGGLFLLQLKYNAIAFYDEFLGWDVRQVPQLAHPIYYMTATVVATLASGAIIVAAIGINRIYRI